ncbi:MAG: sensor histidine kinase [Methanobacterium sp.]|nr:sensor histidine kinase [Methanobacterium sp.]
MRIESLRTHLLIWLLAALAGVVLVNLVNSRQAAVDTADMVSDRMLLASATAIAEEIAMVDGVPDVQVPPAAIEMFNTGFGDVVFLRVQTPTGRLLAGYPDLPQPGPGGAGTGRPVFYQAAYRGRPLRLVAMSHAIIGAERDSPASVVVGATLYAHDDMVRDLLVRSVVHQLILVLVAAAVVLFGFRRVMAPILRLRDTVLDDRRDALEPIPVDSVQTELRPLVGALNTYKDRVRMQMAAQSRFVANAAHQLTTPLTLLATQAAVAPRARDDTAREEALSALQAGVRQFAHMVNQLLTLSRAEPGARRPRQDRIDLAATARDVLETLSPAALSRRIDLGFDPGPPEPRMIAGDETMIREMLVNLVDNALRYTPEGGVVTVSLDGDGDADRCLIRIADNGPGIPPGERLRVFERFYRVIANGGEGSGLGLAIVAEVVGGHNGTIRLDTAPDGGLLAEVSLPALEGRAGPPSRDRV